MITLFVEDRDGVAHSIHANVGISLMEAIRDAGIDGLTALCGGCLSCATCHVYVDIAYQEFLPPLSSDENDLLDGTDDRMPTSRLSCQIQLNAHFDGLRVSVAKND